jgi:hypothetical protein
LCALNVISMFLLDYILNMTMNDKRFLRLGQTYFSCCKFLIFK